MAKRTTKTIAGSAWVVDANGSAAGLKPFYIYDCPSPMESHTLRQLMNNGNEPSPLPTRNWTRNWKKMPP